MSRCASSIVLALLAAGLTVMVPASAGAAPDAVPWVKQEPLPTPWHFMDVDMVSGTQGWAVASPTTGDHGAIFRTTTGAASWRQVPGLFRQLNAISFGDALHAVAVGNDHRYSTDGGKSWQAGSGPAGTLLDADLVDASIGYASGFGLVQKTTDGGKTWTALPVPIQGNLSGIDFVDASTGWVVGAEGSVFRTTDGGATWVQQRHDASKFFTGVSFVDASTGWVSGNSTILHTTDGGISWTTQTVPAGADAIEVRFVDGNVGYAAGALRTILRTTDGGATWALLLGGVYADPANRYPFNGLDLTDPTHAVAVGNANSVYTTSNGTTWVDRTNGGSTIPFRMARTDSLHLWTANSNSEVLFTVDGGRRWHRSIIQLQQDCETCSNAADVAFLNNREGWVVINGLFTSTSWVWHSIDGGATWQSLFVVNTGPLSGLAIVDARTLVAVSGTNDLIFRTTDAGQTWTSVPHPMGGSWFGAVRFVPGTRIGWAVGSGGKILKSTDGGASWTLQRAANHPINLIDASFTDVNNGWAVGGEELHTTDGGQTWVKVQTGVTGSVSVYAVSPSAAWIGGLTDLARTTDGGSTWMVERPSVTDWFAMTFLDQEQGWAGGQDQLIDDVPGSVWKRSAAPGEPQGVAGPSVVPVRQRPPSWGG